MTVTAVIAPEHDDVIQVALSGALSMVSAVEVRRVLHKCLAEQPIAVIVDVAALRVEDPLSLTVFPTAVAAQASRHTALVLVSAPPALRAMVAGRFTRSVGVCDSAEHATAVLADRAVDTLCHKDLPAESSAAPRARAAAAKFCEDQALWEAMDSVMLVVSELVSNAVKHARSALRVRLAIRGPHLYVSVLDRSTRPPVLGDVDHLNVSPLPRHGRGLHLVDIHSSAWGSIPSPAGKTVWAAIRIVPAFVTPGVDGPA